ncbi:Ig-like domain-containing protein [Planococcus sp. APC 3900]|uniref:Ig-like domain-containing protein n=1 Tax=Planococcus sp. APC 3900 TaxID=3035191 RepID=UPI0025B4794A|nr:Ig-like domain-containing protein [Planococcus sp. APC 3900]MDN3437288.1 Ig-like domain-containing protein [Planococcus sp. APC 3900]
MNKLLRLGVIVALLLPVSLGLAAHTGAEATDETFIDVQKFKMDNRVSTLDVFDDHFITTYRDYADQAAVISSYSETGELNWKTIQSGPNAITKDKFATVDRNVLYIYSTATGKVVATGNYPKLVTFGTVSRIYMNDNYVVLTNKQSKTKNYFVYDTNGKFIMDGKAEGFTAAVLNKNTLVFQDAKGVHSINLATRQKVWDVPLESRMNNQHTFVPDESVIYAQGVESISKTDSQAVKDVVVAINAKTGTVLYKKDLGDTEETRVQVKDFGLLISQDTEEIHDFHYADGRLKMKLDMGSPEIEQLKQKNNIQGNRYNFVQKFIASQDELYYFKQYTGIHDEYMFSSIQGVDDAGTVTFEKVLDKRVEDIATTDSNKLFVAKRLDYSGELDVYDSNGNLLDTLPTEPIEHLRSDGSSIYGVSGSTMYIFKESEPKKDTIAPNAPKINIFSNLDSVLSGKAEKGAMVYAYAGGKLIGETKALWSAVTIQIPKQADGTAIDIYAVDKAGNKSAKTTIKVIDKIAPTVPTVDVVGDNSVVVSGKAESGAKVYAYAGSKKLGEATAKDGRYSVKIAKQKAGTSISVHAVDAAGNKSGVKTIKVVDKTAPSVPTVNAVGDNSTAVSGKAESGAKVYAYVGSKKLGEATAKNGAYSIKIVKQKAGTSIAVYAVDPAKNKSGSKTVKVEDKTAPAVPTVNKVTTKSTSVSGKGEKAATVLIYNGSKKIAQGTVDSKGTFNVKISKQKKGVSLKVQLQDKAGNKSGSKTVKVN